MATKTANNELFSKTTQSFIYNNQVNAIQMLDFDYASGRETPSVAAIVNPTGSDGYAKILFGTREILTPIYKTIEKQRNCIPTDVLINFARSDPLQPLRKKHRYTLLRTIVIIAEGVQSGE
jgi:ATP citrate (pro-S)-lyase